MGRILYSTTYQLPGQFVFTKNSHLDYALASNVCKRVNSNVRAGIQFWYILFVDIPFLGIYC